MRLCEEAEGIHDILCVEVKIGFPRLERVWVIGSGQHSLQYFHGRGRVNDGTARADYCVNRAQVLTDLQEGLSLGP